MNRKVSGTAILLILAGATVCAHLYIGEGYGFHRDELATLEDARHLDWGYVAYPPVTPFFGRLSLILFGTSVVGFRFFASLVAAASIVITGLIARELGGGRLAQVIAAVAAIPFCLACGSLMQYVAFDYFCWVLAAYLVLRLINSGNPRWWIAIGCVFGVGMLTKYSILFLIAGVVVGVLATQLRTQLKSKWLWLGVACSLAVFLPNLLWQIGNHFVSLDFLRHIHERDIRIGRTRTFLPDQLLLTLLAFPIALAGLYFYFFRRENARFRALGWMYVVPLVLFLLAQGRGYYLAPAYSILYAGGAVCLEKLVGVLRPVWTKPVLALVAFALTINVALTAAVALPIAPINSRWWAFASKINGDLPEEIGWPDLVDTIAQIRDGLPPAEQERLGILAANYGEAGAINLYGPDRHLPRAISGVNSFWQRGYGDPPPTTLIVVGFSPEFVQKNFDSFTIVAQESNRYGVTNEETKGTRHIYLCHGMREPWPEFWRKFRRYG